MVFLAGERLTAARLNRLQSVVYGAIGSGTVAASQTNADVTDATVTFTTTTANAQYKVWAVWDFNATGVPGGSSTARLAINGAGQNPLGTFRCSATSERGTVTQAYEGNLATAGTYTFKLIVTTNTNTTVIGSNSSITVDVQEVA